MARRANAVQKPNRIELDGEWIDIRQSARFDEVMDLRQKAADEAGAVFGVLALFIMAWSFVDESGEMLPATPENVRDNSDALVVMEALTALQSLPFFTRMSRLTNQG